MELIYLNICICLYIYVYQILESWSKRQLPLSTTTTQKQAITKQTMKYLNVLHHNGQQKLLQYFFLNILQNNY